MNCFRQNLQKISHTLNIIYDKGIIILETKKIKLKKIYLFNHIWPTFFVNLKKG